MNIQPGNSIRRRPVKRESGGTSGFAELCALTARVGQTALGIMVLGAFFYAYITLDNKITKTETEIRKVERERKELDREITQLKVEEARYSSRPFVVAQIRRFRLPLVPANYRQTRSLTVLTAQQAARTPMLRPGYAAVRNGGNPRN
ncbi:MAG: hypothetical protein MR051_06820 [Lentisphaeria bacterium]|nr:hypothetical protein [Lentisphaeria bacterium]